MRCLEHGGGKADTAGAPRMRGSHAVVIGGSISGLSAARVLGSYFDRVTLVDRDQLPVEPEARVGVPQGRHVHFLLPRGQRELERLFPGLDAALGEAGAPAMDWGSDWRCLGLGGWNRSYHSGLVTRLCSRQLLESSIRRRVVAEPGVQLLQGYEVIRLLSDVERTRIEGILLRPSPRSGQGEGERSLWADLVVDASGRGSKTGEWLESLGYPPVEKVVINSFLGYATRWYRRPAHFKESWKVLQISSRPPTTARSGLICSVEGDRWVVGLLGEARDYPPTDEAAWLEFARTLRSPRLYEAIKDAEPLSPVYGFRRTENRFHHFERLSRWPDNFVVLGDAVSAFNPAYAQGMSAAVLGAVTLDECLAAQRRMRPQGEFTGMAARFQKRLAKVSKVIWLMATSRDFRWPTTEGGRPGRMTRLLYRYMNEVQILAATSPGVHRRMLEVGGLVRPAISLFQPDIVARIVRQAFQGDGRDGLGEPGA